ncbi:uncharacterized protein V1516DRAFT_687820 [Lipomyces oligophaga]|uniref:uncharacterized protein n=1 Tax=Lipomyces oligophaga TaxID=45792 RepID=UPI0034CF3F91
MSLLLANREIVLTESYKEALNGEDANILNIPKDWPELSSGRPKFRFWMSAARKEHYLDCVATQQSIFDDPIKADALGLNALYEQIPSFDPMARWTLREERRVQRKINGQVLILNILSSFFFRTNGVGLSISFIAFTIIKNSPSAKAVFVAFIVLILLLSLAAILLQLNLPHVADPRRLVGACLLVIGLGSIAQYWTSNIFMLLLAVAILVLGSSARDFSDCCMKSFYTFQGYERIGDWDAPESALVDLMFTLVSYKIISIGPAGDPTTTWRRIWVVYGLSSCILSILYLYLMPPSPLEVSSYKVLRKWFTSRELTIMVNRIFRDNPFYVNSPERKIRPKSKSVMRNMLDLQPSLSELANLFHLYHRYTFA